MKVFITKEICAPGVQLLRDNGIEVSEWKEKRELTATELIQYSLEADGILSAGYNRIDKEFLNQCAHLKVISLHSVGYDNVDVAEATRLKIPVGHIAGLLSEPTADVAFLLMLTVSRKALDGHKRIINGDWKFFEPTKHLGISLKNKTLGIFGMGHIGFEMARLCTNAYNMKVIYCSRSQKTEAEQKLGAIRVTFEELLKESDVLSVHSNLTPETRNLFTADVFEKMKPQSIFINTARGSIHNEKDLIKALQNKTIWGAGLDVTSPEPMAKDNPLLFMDSVAVFPHIGSATVETRTAMGVMAAENILAAFRGEMVPHPVNPEVYK